jgi:hypothetical protein
MRMENIGKVMKDVKGNIIDFNEEIKRVKISKEDRKERKNNGL